MRSNTRTSHPSRPRRGLALLIATGTVIGSLAMGVAPASANATTRVVAADGQSITFSTSDSSRGVSGTVDFTVGSDGNWSISAPTRNSNLLFRNVTWTCDLSWGPTLTHATSTRKVPGKSNRTLTAAANDPSIRTYFADIVTAGTADCDVVVG